MSGFQPLAMPADVIFSYDGSFDGFLCCVHESVYSRRLPCDIFAGDAPPTLFEVRPILTDFAKAGRVRRSIPEKISRRALDLVMTVFCSCLEKKELRLLEFLLRAYREGGRLCYSLGDPVMIPLLHAEQHLLNEAHLLRGFVRFADVGGALVSAITPKNFVLPFLARYFVQRCAPEPFMILDKTHGAALIYQEQRAQIIRVEQVEIPPVTEEELRYQALWKRFYDAISIESRENPRCRMTHMPKRYWANMPEVSHLVNPQ